MEDFSLLDDLSYMTEATPSYKRYGLSYKIWFDEDGEDRQNQHGGSPRAKYGRKGNLIPFAIRKEPYIIHPEKIDKEKYNEIFKPGSDELEQLFDFVKRNLDIILDHWYHRITTDELLNKIVEAEELRIKDKKFKKRKYRRYASDEFYDTTDSNDDDILSLLVDDELDEDDE